MAGIPQQSLANYCEIIRVSSSSTLRHFHMNVCYSPLSEFRESVLYFTTINIKVVLSDSLAFLEVLQYH